MVIAYCIGEADEATMLASLVSGSGRRENGLEPLLRYDGRVRFRTPYQPL